MRCPATWGPGCNPPASRTPRVSLLGWVIPTRLSAFQTCSRYAHHYLQTKCTRIIAPKGGTPDLFFGSHVTDFPADHLHGCLSPPLIISFLSGLPQHHLHLAREGGQQTWITACSTRPDRSGYRCVSCAKGRILQGNLSSSVCVVCSQTVI